MNKKIWTSADGKITNICDMSESQINDTIQLLENKTIPNLMKELEELADLQNSELRILQVANYLKDAKEYVKVFKKELQERIPKDE